MFHSSGYFRGVRCPFFEHGLCHRPHCHYRHRKTSRSEARKPLSPSELRRRSQEARRITKETKATPTTSSKKEGIGDAKDTVGVAGGIKFYGSCLGDGETSQAHHASGSQTPGIEDQSAKTQPPEVQRPVEGKRGVDQGAPSPTMHAKTEPHVELSSCVTIEIPSYAPESNESRFSSLPSGSIVVENLLNSHAEVPMSTAVTAKIGTTVEKSPSSREGGGKSVQSKKTSDRELPVSEVHEVDVTEHEIFGGSSDSDALYDNDGGDKTSDRGEIQDQFLRATAPLSEVTKALGRKNKSSSREAGGKPVQRKKTSDRELPASPSEVHEVDVTEQEIFGGSSDSDSYDVNGDGDIHGDDKTPDQEKLQDQFLKATASLSVVTKAVGRKKKSSSREAGGKPVQSKKTSDRELPASPSEVHEVDVTEQEIFGGSSDSDAHYDNGDDKTSGWGEIQDQFLRATASLSGVTKAKSREKKSVETNYPNTGVKKYRTAHSSVPVVREPVAIHSKPKLTSNFAAAMDQGSLYMGKKRTAKASEELSMVKRPQLQLTPNTKIPTSLRQKFLDSFIDEHLKTTTLPQEAYKKALKEEKQLFDHCSRKMIYMNLATLALKKLRSKVEQTLKEQRERSDARVKALSRRRGEKEDDGWSDEDAKVGQTLKEQRERSDARVKALSRRKGEKEDDGWSDEDAKVGQTLKEQRERSDARVKALSRRRGEKEDDGWFDEDAKVGQTLKEQRERSDARVKALSRRRGEKEDDGWSDEDANVGQTLKEQRERSDARVKALSRRRGEKEDDGWSDEGAEMRDKTHSPNSRKKLSLKRRKTTNCDEELKDRRGKESDVATQKVETEPTGLVALASNDTAPTRFGSPHMSPDILDRCSKMELKLAKCSVPRKSDPLFSGSQFYSPPERSKPSLAVKDQPKGRGDDGGMESERRMARKKRQREQSVEDMETRSKSRRFQQSSELGEDMRTRKSDVTAERPHHRSTSPIAKKARLYSSGGSTSECIDLTLELFGDSDSDCVVLSSPEQSPSDWDENETAGMSFASALGSVDGRLPKIKLSLSSSSQTMASSQKGKSVAKTDTKESRKVTVEKTSSKKSFLSTRRRSSSDFEDEPISVRKIRSPATRVPPSSRPTSSVPKTPPVVGGGSAKKHKTASQRQSSSMKLASYPGVSGGKKPGYEASMKLDTLKGKQSSLETRNKETREQQSTSPVDATSHKPSGTLINLSKVAAEHAKRSSLHSAAARPSVKKKAPPAQPPSRPTFSIFKKKEVVLTAPLFHKYLQRYLMTEDQLVENSYPRPTKEEGVASINTGGQSPPDIQPVGSNAMRHHCCRCNKPFIIYNSGQYQTVEDCVYHFGRLVKTREYGEGVISVYTCCQERRDSAGCQVAKMHVTSGTRPSRDTGYVKTRSPSSSNQLAVYALDCEMCYTTLGLQLTRVSVVDMELKPVFEALVKPSHPIVDYNTRFSGLTMEDFLGVETSLSDVQQRLLQLFDKSTILLGHSLESDLKAIKVVHDRVVDTAIVFPHRKGPPYKRALKSLMAEHLQRFIQDNVDGGHDSLEDARACMELMLWKAKIDLQKTTRRVSDS